MNESPKDEMIRLDKEARALCEVANTKRERISELKRIRALEIYDLLRNYNLNDRDMCNDLVQMEIDGLIEFKR